MLALVPKLFDFFGLSGLTDKDKVLLLRSFYADLELSVGHDLASGLSRKDMEDFEEIMRYLQGRSVRPEDDPSLAWLEHVRPDYREVVLRHVERLLSILFANRDAICSIAQIPPGSTGEDPVSQTLEFMMREGKRIHEARAWS